MSQPIIKFYCPVCQKQTVVTIEPLEREHNGSYWGDIMCDECYFAVAEISADEPGEYLFVRAQDNDLLTLT